MTDGLRVNFSEKEATSEVRTPVPRGEYHVKITDIELRECGENSKNPGSPYWGIEFTVQEGVHAERKLWSNCMLFSPALYTFAQLMKALDYNISAGDFLVPDAEDLIGRDVVVRVIIKPQDGDYDERNEVKGIKAWGTASKSGGGKTNALLP